MFYKLSLTENNIIFQKFVKIKEKINLKLC